MSEEQQPASNKRKWILGVAMLLILVILPAGSWFYLRGGLKWRKDAIAELGFYGQIRGAHIIYPDGSKVDQLKENVCVIHNFGAGPDLTPENQQIIETNMRLYDQFGKLSNGQVRYNFRIVMIHEGGTAAFRSAIQKIPSIDYVTWVNTGGLGSWGTILENGYEKFALEKGAKRHKYYYALADTTGQIKCFYNALDEDSVNRMVQQIALLLPPQQ
jgi:hypothetical protein